MEYSKRHLYPINSCQTKTIRHFHFRTKASKTKARKRKCSSSRRVATLLSLSWIASHQTHQTIFSRHSSSCSRSLLSTSKVWRSTKRPTRWWETLRRKITIRSPNSILAGSSYISRTRWRAWFTRTLRKVSQRSLVQPLMNCMQKKSKNSNETRAEKLLIDQIYTKHLLWNIEASKADEKTK